ncbi:DinB family protein [Phytomonospora sp. NPDC050363]|uniref:DinB family protein n=1 Tax=Phytomonospora sp. NPDC050363 TaxID=3155642 RepID=UPI0033D68EE0
MSFTAPQVRRAEPLQAGGERAMLESFLDYHRDTLLHKCSGLDTEQLRTAPVHASSLRLLGLVRHLADVEHYWFGVVLHHAADLPFYGSEDNPRVDLDEAEHADPAEAFDRYRAAVVFARETADGYALDHVFEDHAGQPTSLRWIFLHMIEEYARHNGHADLLRESIDGVTGE